MLNQTKPKLCYLNIEGLITKENNKCKINYLSEQLENDETKLLVATESHLKPDILDEEVNIPNFNLYRCDRTIGTKCGGVALYAHNSLQVSESSIQKYSNSVCEVLMLKIINLNLNVISVYRPPRAKYADFQPCLKKIENYLKEVPATENIMMIGDYNFPFVKWYEVENTAIYKVQSGGTTDEQLQAHALFDCADNFLMQQMITVPTRINNVLDLIYTNNTDMLSNIKVEPASRKLTDHKIITADINYDMHKLPKPQSTSKTAKLAEFNFWSEKCDYEKVNNYLNSVNWDQKLSSETSVSSDAELLNEEIFNACSLFVPKKKPKANSKIPRDRKILFKRSKFLKKKLLSATKQKNLDKINEELEEIQSKLLNSHEAERRRNEASVVKGIKKNSKLFFSYAKKFRKCSQTIVSLKNDEGINKNTAEEMCEILKNQYEKSFNKKKSVPEVSLTNPTDNTNINLNDLFSDEAPFTDIDIADEDIINSIKSTKINSAPGNDYLPPVVLHKCAPALVKPLKIMMKKSLKNADIPQIWKEAIITPIYKGKGDKTDPAQYRPISLTCLIIKLLERIIRSYLIQFLEVNDAFPNSQHGFRPNRSTVTQLLEQYEAILDALGTQSNIDIVMLDYAKAFDKINHSILLHKLKELGISGNLGKWIGNFLLNRTQRVSINGQMSSASKVVSGVPQGTILGPVLFLIYIADIGDQVTKSTLSSYADDSKAHKTIRNKQDGKDLQIDINKLYEWTNTNLMEFNSAKFEVLRIGKNELLKQEIQYKTPEGKCIPSIEVAKDLGVHFNNQGTFSDHVQLKSAKAKQMTGYILRTFLTRDREVMLTLLRSLVFPILDYGSIVWNPHLQKEITLLESAQRRLTCTIEGLENLNYHQRLKELKIYSAQRRRDRYVLLYIFKILQGKIPNPGISYKYSPRRGKVLITPSVRSSRASHANTLIHNSFTRRAPRIFNSIPAEIRNLPNDTPSDVIKNKIDKFLGLITDEPRLPGYLPTNNAASNRLEDQIWVREFLREDHL